MLFYEFKTLLFGNLAVSAEEGVMNDFTVTIGGKEMALTLSIEENLLNEQNVNIIGSFLQSIPDMYSAAKKYINQHMYTNEIIQSFIKSEIEEVEDLSDLFDVDANDSITFEMYVNKLEPRMISIAKNITANIVDCTFDFSMPEEYSDELLVIRFNDKHSVYDITHES